MDDLWNAATEDAEKDDKDRLLTAARVHAAETWGFLAGASSVEDFENRRELAATALDAAVAKVTDHPGEFPMVRVALEDSFADDFHQLDGIRSREAAADTKARTEALSAERATRQRIEQVAARRAVKARALKARQAAEKASAYFDNWGAPNPPSPQEQEDWGDYAFTDRPAWDADRLSEGQRFYDRWKNLDDPEKYDEATIMEMIDESVRDRIVRGAQRREASSGLESYTQSYMEEANARVNAIDSDWSWDRPEVEHTEPYWGDKVSGRTPQGRRRRADGRPMTASTRKTAGGRFEWKWPGTRKADSMVVMPVSNLDSSERIAQGERSIVRFNIETGEGVANWKGSKGKYFHDLTLGFGTAEKVTMPSEFIELALGNEYRSGDAIGVGVFMAHRKQAGYDASTEVMTFNDGERVSGIAESHGATDVEIDEKELPGGTMYVVRATFPDQDAYSAYRKEIAPIVSFGSRKSAVVDGEVGMHLGSTSQVTSSMEAKTASSEAYQIGYHAGKSAGSRVFDGNTDDDYIARVMQGFEDGDPQIMDIAAPPSEDGLFEWAGFSEGQQEEFQFGFQDGFWGEVQTSARGFGYTSARKTANNEAYEGYMAKRPGDPEWTDLDTLSFQGAMEAVGPWAQSANTSTIVWILNNFNDSVAVVDLDSRGQVNSISSYKQFYGGEYPAEMLPGKSSSKTASRKTAADNNEAYVMDESGEGLVKVDLTTLSTERLETLSDEAGSAGDEDMVDSIDRILDSRTSVRKTANSELEEIAEDAPGLFVEWIDPEDPEGAHDFDSERASKQLAEIASEATGRNVDYAESHGDINLFERGQNKVNVSRFFQSEIDSMIEDPSFWTRREDDD